MAQAATQSVRSVFTSLNEVQPKETFFRPPFQVLSRPHCQLPTFRKSWTSCEQPDYSSPKEYSSPKDYSALKQLDKLGLAQQSAEVAAGSGGSAPPFWQYQAPKDYRSPASYQAPGQYGSPASYGPPGSPGGTGSGGAGSGSSGSKGSGSRPSVSRGNVSRGNVSSGSRSVSGGGGSISGGGGSGSGGGGSGSKGGGSDSGGMAGGSGGEGGKPKMSQVLTLVYAALVAIGGVVAYMKKGSKDSLIAASVSSILLLSAAMLIGSDQVLYGSILGLTVSGALLYVMGSRFLRSKKVMPAGLVSGISLVMSVGYLHGIQRAFY